MTNEEEKILEEEDITLEEAAEEAEELQEETQDEVKEVREEIPDDVRLDPDEIRERPVFRGGLRGVADPNMIQKHIDNFLAMLCGDTPVDSNVRTSTEYWLKRLATGEGAGSTKKLYMHNILFVNSASSDFVFSISMSIITKDNVLFTKTTFIDYLKEIAYLFPSSGLARQQSPVNNMAITGLVANETGLMACGIDNQGTWHGSSSNSWNILTAFESNYTTFEDNIIELN